MAEERTQRRLAAILAADVVGFSRLMEADEAGTMAVLKSRRREVLDPLVAKHQGRIFKTTGDGVLVEFGSAVNAVQCAVELQQGMAAANSAQSEDRHIVLRIGVNLGDVMVEGSDLYGDGVNIAARLEALAEPGGILVSGTAHDHVAAKVKIGFEDMGVQTLKNIAQPVRAYRVRPLSSTTHEYRGAGEKTPLQLPAKPSIAVLPFTNMSNDPEQEVFVDGLTEDLITDLSRNTGLFVIARNSTFAYKGRSLDVRNIARDLGVRYLLEGSARRVSGRVRINAQLIDAIMGDHLWADRFDRNLEDIFAVQDEVTSKIVEALIGRLMTKPIRNRPANMEAYDLCVRARGLSIQTAAAAREERLLLEQALTLDPDYAEAHRWLAMNLWCSWAFWDEPMDPTRAKSLSEAQRAVAIDPNDAGNHWVLGIVLAHEQRLPESEAAFATALGLDPNNADVWAMMADVSVMQGRPSDAVDHVGKALRLNPHPPGWYYWLLGQAQYALRDYESAAKTLLKSETYRTTSRRILAASLAQLGRMSEARREAQLFMVNNPHFTIGHWAATQPFRDDKMLKHFMDGYRKAGLPE